MATAAVRAGLKMKEGYGVKSGPKFTAGGLMVEYEMWSEDEMGPGQAEGVL